MEISFELSDKVVGIIFKSKIEKEDINKLHDILRERIEKYGEVSLFLEDQFGDSMSLKALFLDLTFEFTNSTQIKKIAIVSDEKWLEIVSGFKDIITGTDVAWFSKQNRMEAMNWVME